MRLIRVITFQESGPLYSSHSFEEKVRSIKLIS